MISRAVAPDASRAASISSASCARPGCGCLLAARAASAGPAACTASVTGGLRRPRRAADRLGVGRVLAEHAEQPPHLGKPAARRVADLREPPRPRLRQPRRGQPPGLGEHRDHRDVVRDHVVQLTGDPRPLAARGVRDERPRERLARRGVRLRLPRRADREARPRRHGHERGEQHGRHASVLGQGDHQERQAERRGQERARYGPPRRLRRAPPVPPRACRSRASPRARASPRRPQLLREPSRLPPHQRDHARDRRPRERDEREHVRRRDHHGRRQR